MVLALVGAGLLQPRVIVDVVWAYKYARPKSAVYLLFVSLHASVAVVWLAMPWVFSASGALLRIESRLQKLEQQIQHHEGLLQKLGDEVVPSNDN